jgi:hypothetical protein
LPVITSEQTTVCVGGLAVRFNFADPEFCASVQERYSGFVQPAGNADCQLDVEVASHRGLADPDADVTVERTPDRWIIKRGDFEAEWNPSSRRGRIRQIPNPYSIDTVLRIIHTLELAKQGGFLLHASSVVRNGRAFLFSGVSGAGKTTISRLAPADCILLTDEISYVRPQGIGPNRSYFAFGTPFAGELAKPGENISAALAAAYLLKQGPENRIDPIDELTAVRALMRNVLFFAADPALVKLLFDTVCDFVARVPVARLTFLPEQKVWDLIR